MPTQLQALRDQGQSPWIDFITRRFLEDGELGQMIRDGAVGVTSNPTIFQKAIADDELYDEQLQKLASDDINPYDAFIEIACEDIRNACDQLAETHAHRGPRGIRDGWVSLEVDPRLAHDTVATLAEARRLHELVDRPNLMVKIPGTEEGLGAIESATALGIPVNVTLLFSLRRHRQAAEAYVRGLRRLHEAGGELSAVASVASFFVSRVDTEADRRLDEIGGHDELKGKLAIANAKLAYQTYREVFSGLEWEELIGAGATPQRCLWASTSAKNPAYRDVVYVEQLIGPETVNTLPLETIRAFEDHGEVARTIDDDVDRARRTLQAFSDAGVDYDDVVATLEREGVQKFADSFHELIESVASSLRGAGSR
ncbi:MAG TPA: transaldolase [Solirubrobacteraceae bacterium]|jgi:transaldolase|nr:transaldolase [Solirubrobacteraceae bacterium]